MVNITVENIFSIFLERLDDEGIWFMLALRRASQPLLKDKLKDEVNRLYLENNMNDGDEKLLVTSRYILDKYTERLVGAGLVNVTEIGKARLYSLSQLGEEFLEFNKRKRIDNN
ncbi:hypothetical protein M3202_18575 [Alkalihalobacillus oceani]|uniref:DNA-binding protein n=1 Tax=Halalkalibacter oceani TaxID=1653776 RepID=A0A9X2IQP0_9BACI|nr:hypothetical protein [Halalkalibacter oceani]MCM3716061.1 hypothetical protein [Halalkalibacter oceani]